MIQILRFLCAMVIAFASCATRATEEAPVTARARLRVPQACPECRCKDIVPIAYGLLTKESQQLVTDGKAIAGGCEVSRDYPDWSCTSCKYEWYDATDPARKALWDAWDAWQQEAEKIFEQTRAAEKPPNSTLEPTSRHQPHRKD